MVSIDEVFNDSYERCLSHGGLLDKFYDRYIASDQMVARKFANTDLEKQKRMLNASLHMILALRNLQRAEAVTYFKRIGVTHDRKHHDIAPEFYDIWLTSLIEAVEECDNRFSPEVETAWRELFADGIGIMKSMY